MTRTDGNLHEPNRLAQIYEFVAILLSGEQRIAGANFAIEQELRSAGTLTPADLSDATWHALRGYDSGLTVDWREGPIMTQTVRWALEGAQGLVRPHEAPKQRSSDPEEPEPFVWEDESVEEGLKAFARWLDINRNGVCLLSIPTSGDVYFSAYCPKSRADLAIAQFELAGLSTSVIGEVDVRERSALSTAEAIADVVVGDHGFTASGERVGRFHKEISDRYSWVVEVVDYRQVALGVAHHEMNELGRTIRHDERMVRTYPTYVLRTITLREGAASLVAALEKAQDLSVKELETQMRKQHKGNPRNATLRRLLDKKWPKLEDKNMRSKDQMAAKAHLRGNLVWKNHPYYLLQGAIADSTREYLDKHSIAYGDNR